MRRVNVLVQLAPDGQQRIIGVLKIALGGLRKSSQPFLQIDYSSVNADRFAAQVSGILPHLGNLF